MKGLLTILLILLVQLVFAQSPGLTVHVKMDSIKAGYTRYKIFMKICEPKKMTKSGDWFTHDTSTIDFSKFKSEDITCGPYFGSNEGLIQLSGEKKREPDNYFEYNGQVFAWEKLFVFKIANWSSRGWWPEMYIVLPVKYKSFRTQIDLWDIEFQSGKVIFLKDFNAAYGSSKLVINQSLKNMNGVDLKGFSIEKILQEK